jgi:hypothetical protein
MHRYTRALRSDEGDVHSAWNSPKYDKIGRALTIVLAVRVPHAALWSTWIADLRSSITINTFTCMQMHDMLSV